MASATLSVAAAAFLAALVDSATDVLALVAALAAALAGIGYIIRQLRALFSRVDDFTDLLGEKVPERLDAIDAQRQADRDENESAHTEMLSAVTALGKKVDALGGKLDDLAARQEKDHDHLQALTRDLDVPVRRRSAA